MPMHCQAPVLQENSEDLFILRSEVFPVARKGCGCIMGSAACAAGP